MAIQQTQRRSTAARRKRAGAGAEPAAIPRGIERKDYVPPAIDPNVPKMAIRTIRARAEGGTKTEAQVRDFAPVIADEPDTLGGTNLGPTPLETLLVSLVSCQNAMIHGVAKAMRYDYRAVDFECSGQMDIRGAEGVRGVVPYFDVVYLRIAVHSKETPARLERLRKNVELRCPVMNLLRDAGVTVTADWVLARA